MPEIIRDVKDKMTHHRALEGIPSKFPSDFGSRAFQSTCHNIENNLSVLHDTYRIDEARDCIISLKHLKIYYQALKWADLARLSDALAFLDTELSHQEISGNMFAKRYTDFWRPKLESWVTREYEYANDKLRILKEELDIAFSQEHARPIDSPRVLVFVEYRRLTFMLRDWINSLDRHYKAERFVSTLIGATDFGMTSEESRLVMAKFRDGEINILVATTVISEGIDVSKCTCSIRYMFMKDVIEEIQIPGRVRASGGRVVAIANEQQFQLYRENKKKERDMAVALQMIRDMPAERFMQMITDEQEREYRARRPIRKKVTGFESGFRRIDEADLICKQCGEKVGQLQNIRRYLENAFIVLDKNLLDNVEIKEGSEYASVPIDGMTDIGILVCKRTSCRAELGKVIHIKISRETRKLGVWRVEKIRIVGSDKQFRKWDDVLKKYTVRDIKQEELRRMIQAGYCISHAKSDPD
ncbi:interferon-induced helicase C domain-containing protein 1-like [Watersipora subatra]|uniref:interferon-induced helicase C domain-containing protein 1-like n=1 Tax=Watersipora subatra TaxID=2589382 RepID=UPI00355BC4FB